MEKAEMNDIEYIERGIHNMRSALDSLKLEYETGRYSKQWYDLFCEGPTLELCRLQDELRRATDLDEQL